ncbi:MAG: radical SAM protein [Methanobacteriota archaeon]|nr:MAG: radical SAM protein [Euryarchaeota archaeon]
MAIGAIPEGCRLCEEGAKMVLFVTGLCSYHCFYCPVSDEKMYKDVVYDADVLAEARAIRAKGVGITGGDPMEAIDRLCHYLRLLKAEFGPSFHAHLYTMTTDEEKIRRVAEAGLDEIRFHVPPGLWRFAAKSGFAPAVRLARELGMVVGLEVPLVPDRPDDLVELLRWAESEGLSFVNLDEMEFSEANWGRMHRQNYATKAELSYGVQGADEVASSILARPWRIPVHYCTSGYKDGWQLRTRIQRRAGSVARPYDEVTEDGTLVKGVVEADDLAAVVRELRTKFRVPSNLMMAVPDRNRVEVASWVLEEISTDLPWPSFVIEEYPTANAIEVERQRLPGL